MDASTHPADPAASLDEGYGLLPEGGGFTITRGPDASCVLLYLHGFNSMPRELETPLTLISSDLNAHLVAARHAGHGLADPMDAAGLSANALIRRAADYYELARQLHPKVVIVGSSMGAAVGLCLAAERPVDAIVAWSPGIEPVEGALLEHLCASTEPLIEDTRPADAVRLRWNPTRVHVDAFRALRDLFRHHMTSDTFIRVETPLLMQYYFRNAENQDPTSRVDAMEGMFASVSTPSHDKQAIAYPDGVHNIASPYRSPCWEQVCNDAVDWLAGKVLTTA